MGYWVSSAVRVRTVRQVVAPRLADSLTANVIVEPDFSPVIVPYTRKIIGEGSKITTTYTYQSSTRPSELQHGISTRAVMRMKTWLAHSSLILVTFRPFFLN